MVICDKSAVGVDDGKWISVQVCTCRCHYAVVDVDLYIIITYIYLMAFMMSAYGLLLPHVIVVIPICMH